MTDWSEDDWLKALMRVVYTGAISRSQYLRVDNNDAEPMSRDEIIMRRKEAIGMQQITLRPGFYDNMRLLRAAREPCPLSA